MAFSPISRPVRLGLAVAFTALLVYAVWGFVLQPAVWHNRIWARPAAKIVGLLLFAIYLYVLKGLGFEEEVARKHEAAGKLSAAATLALMIVFILTLAGFPLFLLFSFVTDSPYYPTVLTLLIAGGYLWWKWYRMRLRQG